MRLVRLRAMSIKVSQLDFWAARANQGDDEPLRRIGRIGNQSIFNFFIVLTLMGHLILLILRCMLL